MRSTVIALATLFAVAAPARAEVKPGERSPDFAAKTFSGSDLRVSALRGKVVLLDCWASWSEPCKKELPLLHVLDDAT